MNENYPTSVELVDQAIFDIASSPGIRVFVCDTTRAINLEAPVDDQVVIILSLSGASTVALNYRGTVQAITLTSTETNGIFLHGSSALGYWVNRQPLVTA